MSLLLDDSGSAEYAETDVAVVTAYPLTLACHFRCDDAASSQAMIAIADKDVADQLLAVLNAGGNAGGDPVRIFVNDGTFNLVSTTTGYSVDTWHHACGRFISTTSRNVRIDGGSEGSSTTSVAPAGADRTSIGRIGDSTPGAPFSGRIANAAVWSVDLSDSEVLALAGGVSPLRVRPESLVAYWPLIDATDPTPDYIGTNNLTLFNSPVGADHAPVAPSFGFGMGWQGQFAVAGAAATSLLWPPPNQTSVLLRR